MKAGLNINSIQLNIQLHGGECLSSVLCSLGLLVPCLTWIRSWKACPCTLPGILTVFPPFTTPLFWEDNPLYKRVAGLGTRAHFLFIHSLYEGSELFCTLISFTLYPFLETFITLYSCGFQWSPSLLMLILCGHQS